ncbi:MAG: hydantoinase/oxoprolinase family protein [Proteobacteria bacterium]|nr:MAG: hydantoinase/oxoprolinase family protein [Pseudomonadota bacterium]
MTLKIGVDTGGTYTDAVLFDDEAGVVAAAKSLTTPHDLAEGIGAALSQLPRERFRAVALVSVSTTLATNAVVEGRGAPVCVLLPGFTARQVERSGLRDVLRNDPVIRLTGGHAASGVESAPLDVEEAERAIVKYGPDVSAFAVSAMFGVRNPEHEVALKRLIQQLCDRPVTCGHELSASLHAPRRALTAALNARLTPFIRRLVDAVHQRLEALGIVAPLMMVKGDGSLVGVEAALERPVDTVLSGPAASVVGACFLSGRQNALVADMGGTTTDIAVVSGGRPETRQDGALVGDWHPMVETLSVFSIGLGGDSEVRFSGGEGIGIGPRRVVPACLLASHYPDVLVQLEQQDRAGSSPRLGHFAVRLYDDPVLVNKLDAAESAVWRRLADEPPLCVESLSNEDGRAAKALARLVRKGLAIYSGFTPTDAAHVVGLSEHWEGEASVFAARIWARQMRHRYGLGNWSDGDAEAPSVAVLQRMTTLVSEALVRTGIRELDSDQKVPAEDLVRFLSSVLGYTGNRVFSVSFNPDYPLLAVGAPARVFFPEAANRLGMVLDVPYHADVAGAVGSVASKVVQKVRVTVTQPSQGTFRVHHADGPRDFPQLDQALEFARETAADAAMRRAAIAGAWKPAVSVSTDENRVDHDIDGAVFFEATVCATATGSPDCESNPRP